MPFEALLVLATAGFLALVTETIPAGMLVQISADMGITESMAGQFVTLYAIGSVVAAIPVMVATQRWDRRALLLVVMWALLILNILTALTSSYSLVLALRFLAGMAGGVLWAMLAGYARRLVAPSLRGRAVALAGTGVPIAFALGIPLGSFLCAFIGWRGVFWLIASLTLAVIIWLRSGAPAAPGQATDATRLPLLRILTTPGVIVVLLIQSLWIVAHSILYTYIMPFLGTAGMADKTDSVLLVFGLASIAGIWLTGLFIDRLLRALVLLSLAGFFLASLALGIAGQHPFVIYVAVALWGLTFGGTASLLQTASANAAGPGADVAQSILTTAWNLAIAVGGGVGAIWLKTYGVASLPWALVPLLLLAFAIAWASSRHGLPRSRRPLS